MSDLAATNCGCGNEGGCGSILWLIVLLSLCNGNGGTSLFGGNGGCGCEGGNSCIWIILLLLCCGGCGGNGFC